MKSESVTIQAAIVFRLRKIFTRFETRETNDRMESLRLRTVLMLLMTSLYVCSAQTQSESGTGIEGVIKVAPIRPGPIKAGDERPQSAPLPNAVFNVTNEKGMVNSFTTDSQGRFRISLTPGHYAVSLAEHRFPHPCGPFDVDVITGKMTRVEWQCDTGMR
jgi:hypothetical protein